MRERVATTSLCKSLGIELDSQGFGLCPFHGDTNKSMKVYPDKTKGWYCYGCHEGGSVIDFAMKYYEIDFRQAIIRLDADFGLNLPLTAKPTARDVRKWREEARKQAEQEQADQQAIEEAEQAYWTDFERYLLMAQWAEIFRPQSKDEDVSLKYAFAMNQLSELKYNAEQSFERMKEVRRIADERKAGNSH